MAGPVPGQPAGRAGGRAASRGPAAMPDAHAGGGGGYRAAARVPRTITDAHVEELVVRTLEEVREGATHWSKRELAKRVGISPTSVHRLAGVRAAALAHGRLQDLPGPAADRQDPRRDRPVPGAADERGSLRSRREAARLTIPSLRSSRPVMRDADTRVDLHTDDTERRISRYRRDLRSSRSATRDPEHERSCPPDIYVLVWGAPRRRTEPGRPGRRPGRTRP